MSKRPRSPRPQKDNVKDMSGTFKKMASTLKPYWFTFVLVIIFALVSTVFSIIGPKIMGNITTLLYEGLIASIQGTGSVDFDHILTVILWLLLIYAISFVFSYLQGFLMAGISRDLTFNLRKRMHQKINRLPISYFDQRSTGEVLSYMTNDIDAMSSNFADSITQVLTSVTTLLGTLYMMFTINVTMTFANLITLPISFGLIIFMMKKTQVHFKQQQENLGNLNGHIEEMYGNHAIVKAYNGEDKSINQFNEANELLYNTAWKSQFFSGLMMPIMQFIGNLGYVVIAILGGYYASLGIISVGSIQSFIQYTRNFMDPIRQLSSISNVFQSSLAAAERVFEFLEEPEEVEDVPYDTDVSNVKGEVVFDHVKFGYDPNVPIIHDFSQLVKPGQQIAIVGPTGAGKTTLVKLLMRFYDVNEGAILIDGTDVRDMKRGDLRSLVGMVLQDTWLYHGTIMENIRYGNLDATDEEVIEAAKQAQVDHFVHTLPEGYDMILNEESSNVSQGQKQLLTIARAILADPTILILDEATSSVDTRTEVMIQKAMEVLMQGRTTFIIAHRLSTIRNADVILVMRDGDIVESGSHDALIAQDGFYAELYNSQFSEEME